MSATLVTPKTTSGGEIIRELVNASDGAGLHLVDGGYVDLTNSAAAEYGTSDFSLEFVLNQTEQNSSANYIYFTHTSGPDRFYLRHTGSDTVILTFRDASDSGTQYTINYGLDQNVGTPTHYVLTCNRDGDATLYANGNSVGTVDISGSSSVDIGATNSSVGRIGSTSTIGVLGTFYRFRTWNKLLSSAEVQTAYERADVDFADQYGSQTELITNSVDRNFTGGSSGWVNQGMSSYNDTGDLSITADASTDYVYLPSGRLGTLTNGKRYALTVTASALSGGSFKIIFGGSNQVVASAITSGANNHEFVYDSSGNGNILIQSNTSAGSITLDDFSLRKVGAVVDLDLAFASPTQSLTIQDRSTNNVDGTASSSTAVTQVQPLVQLNSTSARIGTTAATPADGEVIAEKATVEHATLGRGFFKKTGAKFVEIGAGGTGSYVGYDSSGYLEFASQTGADAAGYSAKMKIASNGNIRIGDQTSNIDNKVKLDVASGNDVFLGIRQAAVKYWHIGQKASDNSLWFRSGNVGSEVDRLEIDGSTGLATFSGGINLGDDTLSNYKEGTWTPTLSKGSTAISSPNTSTSGRYVRIGKSLFVSFYYFKSSAATTTGTDKWTIGGLPFTLQAGTPYQSISCGYCRIQSTSHEFTSPYRWEVNSSDGTKLFLRGTQCTSNNTGGNVEFSGFGVFEIA